MLFRGKAYGIIAALRMGKTPANVSSTAAAATRDAAEATAQKDDIDEADMETVVTTTGTGLLDRLDVAVTNYVYKSTNYVYSFFTSRPAARQLHEASRDTTHEDLAASRATTHQEDTTHQEESQAGAPQAAPQAAPTTSPPPNLGSGGGCVSAQGASVSTRGVGSDNDSTRGAIDNPMAELLLRQASRQCTSTPPFKRTHLGHD